METLLTNHRQLGTTPFLYSLEPLISKLRKDLDLPRGNAQRYTDALKGLPAIKPSLVILDKDQVTAGTIQDIPMEGRRDALNDLESSLMALSPWRKGPFRLFDLEIDSEWRSNLKWDRFAHEISSLRGRRILDIGSSNGYYMFRAAAREPWMVLGVEPQHTFYFQYLALQKYLNLDRVFCLPIPFDDLPMMEGFFDTVFCMGILYHRKSPIDMLKNIQAMMKKGGEIILENLIVTDHPDLLRGSRVAEPYPGSPMPLCLCPEGRYAKMRNVYFIPNPKTMESWLKRTGFHNIRWIDISATTPEEQRKTPWIATESLTDFLDPHDPSKTVEGYPAPVRAIVTARS
ncbi:MAG: tRNA 5-methoxyuridine(34)/uridine 5-oxyacetic acid(34) synthase CmoB [Desulfamplus sp.]|nr:tRNA 5-methoxyuridine(34)/uridine 5-oxyacetic acid(34) synthase CmoB [Desulfamplus sp.]